MVTIERVSGECLIMDGSASTTPVPRMTLETTSPVKVYILITGSSGSMDLSINTKKLKMQANSVLRVRGPKSELVRTKGKGSFHQIKIWIGHRWAEIKGPEPFEEIVNAATGVRG